jgi:ribosome maturation factor RimP
MTDDAFDGELERHVEELGYELVALERAGSRTRPILRLRVDRPDGGGVSVADCARISRALEPHLDADPRVSERYTLEVSSPGVERPLVRDRDFERFAGAEIAVHGSEPLAGRARRLQGELIGIAGDDDGAVVQLRLESGEQVDIPRAEITRAHLIFRWNDR